MKLGEIECLSLMVYHGGYAVPMETCIPDPNIEPLPVVSIFELDRIDDVRDAIDRGYWDVAASYGDLYRMIPLAIAPDGAEEPAPRYDRYRTRMEDSNGYVIEMQTELTGIGSRWAASIALQDLPRLDAARKALNADDLQTAAQYGRVYRLELVNVTPAVKPWRPSEREAEWQAKGPAGEQSPRLGRQSPRSALQAAPASGEPGGNFVSIVPLTLFHLRGDYVPGRSGDTA